MANGFWDTLLSGVGDAIADARSKLIDEGWFGRSEAPGAMGRTIAETPEQSLYGATRSFEELWAPRVPGEATAADRGPECEAPGIDR